MTTKYFCAAAAVAAVVLWCAAAWAQTYTIKDVGTLAGGATLVQGINASGQATGYSMVNGVEHAFLYDGTTLTDLLGTASFGNGINASGQVVGLRYVNSTFDGFLDSGGRLTDFNTTIPAGLSIAEAINKSGQVVGYYNPATGGIFAFLYSNGTTTDLGTLGAQNTVARAINTGGQIVGSSVNADGIFRAFLYSGNTMTDLGAFTAGAESIAFGINDSGQAVGNSNISCTFGSGTCWHAALFANNTVTDLGTLDTSNFSIAYAINASGQVVGYATALNDTVEHAFLYQNGTMTDLNTLLPANSGWDYLPAAYTVNDAGQIGGVGFIGGQLRGFIMTPVPPYKAYIQQPINANGSSVFSANKGVVPVKFTLTLNGTATCTLPQATFSISRISGGTSTSIDESTYSMSADAGSYYRIDTTACQYVYNLASSSLGAGTYQVNISISGAVVGSAIFGLQ